MAPAVRYQLADLRRFFEVDQRYVALAALTSLARRRALPGGRSPITISPVRHSIPDKADPAFVVEDTDMAAVTGWRTVSVVSPTSVIEVHVAPGDIIRSSRS